MSGWNIAILGAGGAVGSALIDLLQEHAFPIDELFLLASENSVGNTVRFNGKTVMIRRVESMDWSAAQLAFFIAGDQASLTYAEQAAAAGCLVIDLSSAYTLDSDVPLVVPDVNSSVLSEYRNRNIVTVAQASVTQLLTAIYPLIEDNALKNLKIVQFMSASSQGKDAITELAGQSAKLLNGLPIEKKRFTKQLAFNLLPHLSMEGNEIKEEMITVEQIRKVLQDFHLPCSISHIQSPVFYGNAQLVHLECTLPLLPQDAIQRFTQTETLIVDQQDYPTQVDSVQRENKIHIGCVGNDYGNPESLHFWSVADNIRFCGAFMAVRTAEILINNYL